MSERKEIEKKILEAINAGKPPPKKLVEQLKKLPKQIKPEVKPKKHKQGIRLPDNKVVAIRCLYHKKIEPIRLDIDEFKFHQFTEKRMHSPTGYNAMCQEGQRLWSAQDRQWTHKRSELIIEHCDKPNLKEFIEQERIKFKAPENIIFTEAYNAKVSFDSEEEFFEFYDKYLKRKNKLSFHKGGK